MPQLIGSLSRLATIFSIFLYIHNYQEILCLRHLLQFASHLYDFLWFASLPVTNRDLENSSHSLIALVKEYCYYH